MAKYQNIMTREFAFFMCPLTESLFMSNPRTFLYTDPPSALGFWFALEPCTKFNGALSFLPGSHRNTPITKRFVRLPEGGTGFEEINEPIIPLGLQDKPAEPAGSVGGDYILETCDGGSYLNIIMP